jgi:hypothetical protein
MADASEDGRLARVIEQVENGEPVDWQRVALLQTLDIARAGQRFLTEALEREENADEQLRSLGP